MAAPEIPATAEVILKTDASKQFLDTLLGQGWDAWGEGLGGFQAAELMLQLVHCRFILLVYCLDQPGSAGGRSAFWSAHAC
jgi:hypothetical protein